MVKHWSLKKKKLKMINWIYNKHPKGTITETEESVLWPVTIFTLSTVFLGLLTVYYQYLSQLLNNNKISVWLFLCCKEYVGRLWKALDFIQLSWKHIWMSLSVFIIWLICLKMGMLWENNVCLIWCKSPPHQAIIRRNDGSVYVEWHSDTLMYKRSSFGFVHAVWMRYKWLLLKGVALDYLKEIVTLIKGFLNDNVCPAFTIICLCLFAEHKSCCNAVFVLWVGFRGILQLS